MESLSDEILVRIFSFLTARDLCRCSQVSIMLNEVVQACKNYLVQTGWLTTIISFPFHFRCVLFGVV